MQTNIGDLGDSKDKSCWVQRRRADTSCLGRDVRKCRRSKLRTPGATQKKLDETLQIRDRKRSLAEFLMEFPRQKAKCAGGIANVVSFDHADSRSLCRLTYAPEVPIGRDEG